MVVFADRVEAGRHLAGRLRHLAGEDVVVLALPRGGVPVAVEVARALGAPLDVIVVRKLGVPFQPELAMGAIGEGGVRLVDRNLVARLGLSRKDVDAVEQRERRTLERRAADLRRGRPGLDLRGRTAVVVDDGVATGSTARVACEVARELGAGRVVLAVPVAPREALTRLPEADEVVVASTPDPFIAVGNHYRDFSATTDEEVVELLAAFGRGPLDGGPGADDADGGRGGAGAAGAPATDRDVSIPVDGLRLEARLTLPRAAVGVVAFAHGSGSGRHSPRNRFVAEVLQGAGLGTLLLDLLTTQEESDRENVFDIALLAARLRAATTWLADEPETALLPVGYFGASTGAGAALVAAAAEGDRVRAVVSRGGRPDLAGDRLAFVRAPTLLVVGSRDEAVLRLNVTARGRMTCPTDLRVVEGATHLFEEPGTLDEVARLAASWFLQHLAPGARTSEGGPGGGQRG